MKPEFAYNIGIKGNRTEKQSQEEGKHEKKSNQYFIDGGNGDEKSADSQGNQSSGDAKTVTMMSWYSEDQMDDVIDAIEKKLGGEYKIDYTYVTNSDYNNVLSTQLAAGEGPDGLLVFFTIKIFLKRQALKRFRLHMMNFLKHATS